MTIKCVYINPGPEIATVVDEPGTARYVVGNLLVITTNGPPLQADIDAFMGADPASTAEKARLAAIDANIAGFSFAGSTLAQLKAMDNNTFDTWWAANITSFALANNVLKLIARTMLRRVL